MIIGIDFGTTNTRVAVRESTDRSQPELRFIGQGGTTTMPSVIAYERLPAGTLKKTIGEDADRMAEADNRVVLRNVKRWALTSDYYVRRTLEGLPTKWPSNLNMDKRAFDLWEHSVSIDNIISDIIGEALKRAGLDNVGAEVRAGCPVHSDLTYRQILMKALFAHHGYTCKVSYINEEPILFLVRAYSLGRLNEGSYMIYDFGGGSFDCALATVKGEDGKIILTIYAASGDPLLGGMDIDTQLELRMGYKDRPDLLRVAKENLSKEPNTPQDIGVGYRRLTYADIEDIMRQERFIERSTGIMLEAYQRAKLMWKRPPGAPPFGEVLEQSNNGYTKKTVWSLRYSDLAQDIDKVILFGGTSKIPFITQRLADILGGTKIIMASQLLPPSIDFPDPEITAAALGACYSTREPFTPLYVDRLPCRIVLRVFNGNQTQETEYSPYSRLPLNPSRPFVSAPLGAYPESLTEYEAIIETCDKTLLYTTNRQKAHMTEHGNIHPSQMRIVIDRFGRVFLNMSTGRDNEFKENKELQQAPPWQSEEQKVALNRQWQEQKACEDAERRRIKETLFKDPFGFHDVG